MKKLIRHMIVAGAMVVSLSVNANENVRLFIIGDATPGGWSLDMAQALLSTAEKPSVYTGTLYLKSGDNNTFKFMENHEWGGVEYGLPSAVESIVVNGSAQLASGSYDDGYKQLAVDSDGNYHITVDTEKRSINIVLSGYQDSAIKYCSLFLIGDATDGGWTVNQGTPLYQSVVAPWEYSAVVRLKTGGSFKIANALRGAGSWDGQYYFFRDADDAGKISSDATDDRQWSVTEDGDYTVTVNTLANSISIDKYDGNDAIDEITGSTAIDAQPEYYNLQGFKVNNPANGVFIEVAGSKVKKVIFN